MKKIFIYITIAIALLMIDSCRPDMDLINPNEATQDNFYKSKENIVGAVNGAYNMLQRNGGWGRYMFYLLNGRGDDWNFTYKAAAGEKETPPICNFTYDASNLGINECWDDMYAMVYAANLALEQIPSSDADTALQERLTGEALFLRGLAYFYLGQLYGEEIPVKTATPKKDADYYWPSAKPGVLYKQMVEDFIKAAELLPERSEMYKSDADVGRATKGSALGFLAKTYMNRPIYEQGTTSEWQKAEEVLQQIIDSKQYGLMQIFRDNHSEQYENNVESLFEVQFFNGVGSYNSAIGEDFKESWGSSDQSTWREQEIGQKDGGDNTNWWNMMPLRKTYDEFEPEDPRRYQSIWCFNGARWRLITPQRWVTFDKFFAKGKGDPLYRQQFACRKYCSDMGTADWESGINDRLIRYSDVLLMFAECKIENGKETEAAQYIDSVRFRANHQMTNYGPADSSLFYTLAPGTLQSVTDLIAKDTTINGIQINTLRRALKHERYVELFGEGWRFTDMLRWSYNPNDPDRATILDPLRKKNGAGNQAFIDGRHEYYPIPTAEITTNPKIKPNRAN